MSVREPHPCHIHFTHGEGECADTRYAPEVIYEQIGGDKCPHCGSVGPEECECAAFAIGVWAGKSPEEINKLGTALLDYMNRKEKVKNILRKAYFNGQTDVVAKLNNSIPNYKHSEPILDFMADDIIKLFEGDEDVEEQL